MYGQLQVLVLIEEAVTVFTSAILPSKILRMGSVHVDVVISETPEAETTATSGDGDGNIEGKVSALSDRTALPHHRQSVGAGTQAV